MRVAAVAILLCCIALPATAADRLTTLEGTVTHVRDGATIEVDKLPIRLNGVSAPDLTTRYGKASKQYMVELVWGKRVRCELSGQKIGDALAGVCFLDGADIGAYVIRNGLALSCPKVSGARYEALETAWARSKFKRPGTCR